MEMKIDTNYDIINMAPVIVSAPTGRNGITLIQRLLNSSSQIIVYGENAHLVSTFPGLSNSIVQLLNNKLIFDQALQHFLNGNTDGWTSNLWPDVSGYIRITLENTFRYFEYYSNFSAKKGFNQWGIKNPMTNPGMINNFRMLLKRARFIIIYRNIFDVVRSAKARKFASNMTKIGNLAEQWQNNLLPILKRDTESILCIKYEDLVQNPGSEIQKLEHFANIKNIDKSVLSRKINTFKGDVRNGHSPNQYIKPVDITDEESEIIKRKAPIALEMTAYQP